MPLQATSGAASYDAFGGGVPVVPNYIEEVFSTYIYTSTGGDITITNGIDLSTKGGLVWIKSRSDAFEHYLTDTVRGAGRVLYSNLLNGQSGFGGGGASSFSTTGYVDGNQNANGITQVSWTFRKQPKFFDVVTYTGTGSNTTISHSLGSVPACIMVKRTDTTGAWQVYHRSLANTEYLVLNTTDAKTTGTNRWNSTTPTSTVFSLGTDSSVNASGGTYVAYLFAHDAGGFGLTGTDNVISCGSYTTNGSGVASVTLGYEPQWILWKRSDSTSDWYIFDTMRGWTGDPANTSAGLRPNLSNAENNLSGYAINATGFNVTAGAASATYIYIAIRRGPMKVPTLGTSVFNPDYAWNTSSSIMGYLGQPTDAFWLGYLSGNAVSVNTRTRLVGGNRLTTSSTSAEVTDTTTTYWDSQLGFQTGGSLTTSLITWNFRRAPSFMDVVCYTGTGVARTVAHNLAAVPELMIVKRRNTTSNWQVYSSALGATSRLQLNTTDSVFTGTFIWNDTAPTASVFSLSELALVNNAGDTYVNYLFATCAGVSKVGSYTGNGSSQTINCGFTGGARFVLIKRTDSTGDWMVSDSARGIVSGNDPYLELNNTNAEVTGEDWLDTDSTGFVVNEVSGSNANTSSATYIFLAIA